VDGTPLYDIKPYIPYSDCHPDATGGFIDRIDDAPLEVSFPEEMLRILPHTKRSAVISVLAEDPRPGYQNDPSRVYGIYFAGYNVRFTVSDRMLTVVSVEPMEDSKV
ncbi:MAG: tRNA (N6-threonylcarbamoyladenosine(37)-N6)-methyltransferase TrmO, partial [Lentihominibacter sp.]|nr:tRNA (N6-threonylcarbamoyladenosine(37)-N6)-methyltransferase TrmO [Lentihominibacter sp.]